MSSKDILPAKYYYPLLVFDVGFAALFGTLTILNPMQGFIDQVPLGYDKLGDAIVLSGVHSPRVALTALLGGVMGPVWAITTATLLPLARNGMSDRPDLAEKVTRGLLISGAVVDPLHLLALLYYLPTDLLLSPAKWNPMVPVGFVWLTVVTSLKVGWCAGFGRASASHKVKRG